MEEQLDNMFSKITIVDSFVISASTSFGTDLKEYKGIPIHYFRLMPKDYIVYGPSMYAKDYKFE